MTKKITKSELIAGLLFLPDAELVIMIQKIYFMPSETLEECVKFSNDVKILILDSVLKAYADSLDSHHDNHNES